MKRHKGSSKRSFFMKTAKDQESSLIVQEPFQISACEDESNVSFEREELIGSSSKKKKCPAHIGVFLRRFLVLIGVAVAVLGFWIRWKARLAQFFDDSCLSCRVGAFLPGDASYVPTNVTWMSLQDNTSNAECCPYAKILYKHKYKYIDYRCCFHNPMVQSQRAMGGGTWKSQTKTWNILIQGDSLEEQHFLSLLCRAWYEGLPVALKRRSIRTMAQRLRPHNSPAYIWHAYINDSHVVTFLRTNLPVVTSKVNYNYYDVTMVGGWHHRAVTKEVLESHKQKIPRLVWVEALPSHFLPRNQETSDGAACEDVNQPLGTPNVNYKLNEWFPNIPIVQAAHLYANGSALHVGHLGHGHRNDCLHWCVPSLDAWARQTLLLLYKQTH